MRRSESTACTKPASAQTGCRRPAGPSALGWRRVALALGIMAMAAPTWAAEGGLYIADKSFSFQVAVQRAMAQNPGGRRFFVLAVPPQTEALLASTRGPQAALRERALAANGVLLVCQRDIDNGRIDAADLAPGVVAVRGWPAPGSNALPKGQRYFADEDRAQLPASNEALRRLRSTCS